MKLDQTFLRHDAEQTLTDSAKAQVQQNFMLSGETDPSLPRIAVSGLLFGGVAFEGTLIRGEGDFHGNEYFTSDGGPAERTAVEGMNGYVLAAWIPAAYAHPDRWQVSTYEWHLGGEYTVRTVAYKASDALSPIGLTGWTNGSGFTGDLTVADATVPGTPGIVYRQIADGVLVDIWDCTEAGVWVRRPKVDDIPTTAADVGAVGYTDQTQTAEEMLTARRNVGMVGVGKKPRTHIILTDDDVGAEVMTHLLPILSRDMSAMAALGINTTGMTYAPVPATLAIVTTTMEAGSTLSWTNLRTLRDTHGWEMATHGHYHRRPELEGESQTTDTTHWGSWEESTNDWTLCRDKMRAEGIYPENHIYLFNAQDHRFHQFLRSQGVSAAVGSNDASQYRNVLPLASWSIVRYDMAASNDATNDIAGSAVGIDYTVMDTIQKWKDAINRAIADPVGDVFVFGLHSWKWTTGVAKTAIMQTLADLIQWIQSKADFASGNIVFSTVASMMAECGNVLEAGRQKNQIVATGPKQYALAGSFAVSKTGAVRWPNSGVAVDSSPTSVTASTPATSFPLGKVSWVSQDASHGGSGWPVWNFAPSTEGVIMTNTTSHLPGCWFQEFQYLTNGDVTVRTYPAFARRNWISVSGVWQWGPWMWFTGNVGSRLVVSATWTPGTDVTIAAATGYKTPFINLSGAAPTHRVEVTPISSAWTEASGGIPVALDWGRGYINSLFGQGFLLFFNLNPTGGADVVLKAGRGWRVNVFENAPTV